MTPSSLLDLLHQLSTEIAGQTDLEEALNHSLELIAEGLGACRAAVTFASPVTGKIRIEASYGLNQAEKQRGIYKPGEGVTGRVIKDGIPLWIKDVSADPDFLNRTGSRDLPREKLSFLCVPIRLCGQVVGALSIDHAPLEKPELEEKIKILEVIAHILAQAAGRGPEARKEPDIRSLGFIGSSESMLEVYEQLSIVAPAQTTVLLQGESGTGKELAARAIHNLGKGGPFISLNCAALPESLLESELFGHEKGAFTGASQMRKGRFELANGGTLFLDEIGELSPFVQAKLLRVLQERTFERVGGIHQIHTSARLIAATNQNLAEMVEIGQFRRDLYYRLNVFPIFLPPLRQRRDDIASLTIHFLKHYARLNGREAPVLSPGAMKILEAHAWPGNIRELQNTMERLILLLGNSRIVLPRHIAELLKTGQPDIERIERGSLPDALASLEKLLIIEAVEKAEGRLNQAASILGVSQRILGLRMNKYGLEYKDYRK